MLPDVSACGQVWQHVAAAHNAGQAASRSTDFLPHQAHIVEYVIS